jgi:hypothetical protein
MAALTSMKMAPGGDKCCPTDNEYGYGLCLSLSAEQCEALGILGPIKPGTVVGLQAIATVMSATEEIEKLGESGTETRMQLQITDLGINQTGSASSAATTLYGDD